METNAINVEGVTKRYGADVVALEGVDLAVPMGARFALLGPNGAGKSTLVRILCTLTNPDSGTVRVVGEELAQASGRIRSRIGVALQDLAIDPEARVQDQLAFQCRLYGEGKAAATVQAWELAERFGLAECAGRPARELSGGTRRRLHVALALAHRPSVLFLDEPTVGMDAEIRGRFWDELLRLNREEGMTLFFTTQYLEEARRYAEELAVLESGHIAWRGTVEGFLGQAGSGGGLEEAYVAFLESYRTVGTEEALHA